MRPSRAGRGSGAAPPPAAHAPARRNGRESEAQPTVLVLLRGLGHSFFSTIISAIESTLVAAGYTVIFGDTQGEADRRDRFGRMIESGGVAGAVLFTGQFADIDLPRLDRVTPIVVVCNPIPGVEGLPLFEVANRDAAFTMVEHLVGLGHRRIAHITGRAGTGEAGDRLQGYRDALAAAGIAVDENLIWRGNFSFVAGERAAGHYFSATVPPTAVFAASDEIAIGFIKAAKAAGVAVPGQVSVAGFDGIDYSAMYDPALTTMLQPRSALGRLAAEELLRRMTAGPADAATPVHVRLPCSLVIRDSVAPPPG